MYDKELLERAKKIKVIATDIDGVLTKGELIILDSGEEMKIWDIKDRFAFSMLRKSELNMKLAWITARKSKQVADRAQELAIDFLYQKSISKFESFEDIKSKGFKAEEIAFMGDDWLDVKILKAAGLSVCPKNAVDEARAAAHYVSKYDGGYGVFREMVEIILRAHGLYDKVLKAYTE